jgi:hypothetical protein
MKKILLLLLLCYLSGFCCAQDTVKAIGHELVERTNDPSPNIHEKFTVLKVDKKIKHGLFQAFLDNKTLVASGRYDHGVKVGVWRYCDTRGIMEQAFNYTSKKMLYAKMPDTAFVQFNFESKINGTDTLTYPVKIGGGFYGYNHIIFTMPNQFWKDRSANALAQCKTTYVLNIGADGEITKAIFLVEADKFRHIYEIQLSQLSNEDKLFVPATQNGKLIPAVGYVKVPMTFR